MKVKLIFLVHLFTIPTLGRCQYVEKSLFGIQTGVLGAWVSHEWGFSHHWVLHSEIGLDGQLIGIVHTGDFPVLLPKMTIEPRYYYNLPKRKAEGKDIWHNAANFASLRFTYYPNWFSISNQDDLEIRDGLFILPTWGIRRNINWHFYVEAGAGVGLSINGLNEFEGDDTRLIYTVLARIGYKIF